MVLEERERFKSFRNGREKVLEMEEEEKKRKI